MPARHLITQAEREEIIASRVAGVSNQAIATRMSLHEITVCRIYREFRKRSGPITEELGDWRGDLKSLAIKALRRGLSQSSDPAKAGTLAATVLRGLGEFQSESQIHIATLLNAVPENQKDRYILSDPVTGGDDEK